MPDQPTVPALLGIDWGTSNRRAWWLDASGHVLADHADDQGLLAAQGRFAQAYATLLAAGPALPAAAPTLMSGMVGAASGWVEAPYLDAGEPLAQLAAHLCPVPQAGPGVYIVPGVCRIGADGGVDVMRGEETQLLGALALGHGDGWYLLPGTHSKWVRLADGRVAELATYMTGELYALLTRHGTLASATAAPPPDEPEHSAARAAAFEAGVDAAARGALSNLLFGCRAQVVAKRLPASLAADHLSGLLIGAEWHDVARRAGRAPATVRLIGDPVLARRHTQAAALLGSRLECLDPRVVQLAALRTLRDAMADSCRAGVLR